MIFELILLLFSVIMNYSLTKYLKGVLKKKKKKILNKLNRY